MFLVLSLKQLRLHKALNALSMNWEQFAVRISRQFLKKPQLDPVLPGRQTCLKPVPRGEQHGGSTGRVSPLRAVNHQSDISVQISVLRLPIKTVLLLGNLRQPPKHTPACLHTRTGARLAGKLLLAVWRARGLLWRADTSPVQPTQNFFPLEMFKTSLDEH